MPSINQKKSSKTVLPVVEFKVTEKTKNWEHKNFHLFINGKTDKMVYSEGKEMYQGRHKGKFAKALLEIPCRLFPRNTVTFIETEKQLITGIFEDDCSVMLYSEKNKFSLGLSLSVDCDVSLLVEPNEAVLIEDLEKELKKSAGGLIEVEEGSEVLVSINCIPDKTIKEMLDMLVTSINKVVSQCKVQWIKDAKQLVKKFEAA